MQNAHYRQSPTTAGDPVEISLVVPMYNEGPAMDLFFQKLLPVMRSITDAYEIVCVNDGSDDETMPMLKRWHAVDSRIKALDFSRNFGKEAALTAGIEHAVGLAVIPLDADLQDPPELIPEMVAKWREGYEMVIGVRTDRASDSPLKRISAFWFYRVIRSMTTFSIPMNAGDFRLLDRTVVQALRRLPERARFMKGLFAWVGFKQAHVYYSRPPRSAGQSKWAFWKLWNFALDGIVSFSSLPLRIWTYIGFATAASAIAYMLVAILKTVLYGVDVPGYASLLSVMLFFSGLNMIGLGIIGEYVGRIFLETKRRPLYLVRERIGFAGEDARPAPGLAAIRRADEAEEDQVA